MKPNRLPPNAIAKIQRLHDPKRILNIYTKCALTSDERRALTKRAEALSVELPVGDVTYI